MRATVHPMEADRGAGANEMAKSCATLRSLLMEWCPRRRQARRRHSAPTPITRNQFYTLYSPARSVAHLSQLTSHDQKTPSHTCLAGALSLCLTFHSGSTQVLAAPFTSASRLLPKI